VLSASPNDHREAASRHRNRARSDVAVAAVNTVDADERGNVLAESVNKPAWAVTALALKGSDEPRKYEGKEALRHLAESSNCCES
jgi:hypothetical protein